MTKTGSTMAALGVAAPDFALPDTDGRTVRLGDFADAVGLLVVFMCNHCPFVIHIREELARSVKPCAHVCAGRAFVLTSGCL